MEHSFEKFLSRQTNEELERISKDVTFAMESFQEFLTDLKHQRGLITRYQRVARNLGKYRKAKENDPPIIEEL